MDKPSLISRVQIGENQCRRTTSYVLIKQQIYIVINFMLFINLVTLQIKLST